MVEYENNPGESDERELEVDHFAEQGNVVDREVPDALRTFCNRLAGIDDASVGSAASGGSRGRVMCASRVCG